MREEGRRKRGERERRKKEGFVELISSSISERHSLIHYQIIVSLQTSRLVGFEVLDTAGRPEMGEEGG